MCHDRARNSPDTIPFVPVNVYRRAPPGPHLVRFVERGFGLPPDVADLPWGVNSPTQLGWLRVVDAEDAATAVHADAGRSVVLRRDGRVLLFHLEDIDADTFDPISGFGLRRGDTLCATPFPTLEDRCANIYSTELEVTVPGGATATLGPAEAQTVGDYRVFHRNSTTIERLTGGWNAGNSACADVGNGETRLTAVLEAGAP